ncbi:hypothetical protein Q5P01_003860 [Channa striata]|uniref:Uncharacterized protein n=1 Tax=Channa striata TaxID=64152 RepID=A0AA88NMN2_CHASR|nr:hypothetical protein Q5P01_003860 [Channa striata]
MRSPASKGPLQAASVVVMMCAPSGVKCTEESCGKKRLSSRREQVVVRIRSSESAAMWPRVNEASQDEVRLEIAVK